MRWLWKPPCEPMPSDLMRMKKSGESLAFSMILTMNRIRTPKTIRVWVPLFWKDRGYPEDIIYAIKAHAEHMGVPRNSLMDKTLFAVDELCGFLTAATLVRPGKRVAEVPVKSVKKKLKDKGFARSVNREEIRQGAADLNVDLDEHIAFVRDAMAQVAEDLGLAG